MTAETNKVELAKIYQFGEFAGFAMVDQNGLLLAHQVSTTVRTARDEFVTVVVEFQVPSEPIKEIQL